MLDRIDSIIFIAPFAYFLLNLLWKLIVIYI
jgi:CDP-diglyceride synthetase